jgi:hypothetical protein
VGEGEEAERERVGEEIEYGRMEGGRRGGEKGGSGLLKDDGSGDSLLFPGHHHVILPLFFLLFSFSSFW